MLNAEAQDLASVLCWQSNRDEPVVPLWSGFNALLINATQEETLVAYRLSMPLHTTTTRCGLSLSGAVL